MLELRVTSLADDASWSWQLIDETGSALASHDVRLVRDSTEFQLLTDLYGNRWRITEDPARRRSAERYLIRRVGEYLAAEVLGSIGPAISARAPVTVRVNVPPEAVGLLAMPLELTRWTGGSLAAPGVVFWYDPQARPASLRSAQGSVKTARDPGGPIRALAVFALPETSSALGMVRERRALEGIMRDGPVSRGEAPIDLRVLQYGATRLSLEESLADPTGWDVIHLSGHGGPGQLYLEDEYGASEAIEADELLTWLEPCRGRTGLIVLSACESGVARVVSVPGGRPKRMPIMLPALGYQVAQALGCAVLAMRYPVEERFSVKFIRLWYEAILHNGQPVDDATREVLPLAARAAPFAPLSIATPILLGGAAADLQLNISASNGDRRSAACRPAGRRPVPSAVPGVPEYFVGRTALLRRMGATLAPGGDSSGLVILGMPGIGKTSACAEAAARYASAFEGTAWHRAARRDTARSLARSIAAQLGAGSAPRLSQPGRTDDYGPLLRLIRRERALVVIDDVQNLLAGDGTWADDTVGTLITSLLLPGATSRVVLISSRPVSGLVNLTETLVVPMLSRSEAEWLAVELEELRARADPGRRDGPAAVPWLVCRGHPRLLEYCSAGSDAPARRRTRRLWETWEVFSPPSPASMAARRALGRDHPGTAVGLWAADRAAALPGPARRALVFLSTAEQADRDGQLIDGPWQALDEVTGAENGPLDVAAADLVAVGLAERASDGTYLLHPAVASVGRTLDQQVHDLAVMAMFVFWRHQYQELLAMPGGGPQSALAYCAASQVPYLMRLARWEEASAACEQAINHDRSPRMAARLAAYEIEIIRAARGTPLETKAKFVHAVLAFVIAPGKGIEHFQRLLDQASQGADSEIILVAGDSLARSLSRSDPLLAQRLLQAAVDANAGESFGPWVTVQLSSTKAEILYQLGAWPESLGTAEEALAALDQLEKSHLEPRGVHPHSLRLAILDTAAQTAQLTGRPEQAAAYRAQIAHLADSSPDRSLAETQFNDIRTLIDNGHLDHADGLLQAALATFAGQGNTRERGLVLASLALVEHRRGHPADAIEFGRQALRAAYTARETLDAAAAHRQMAFILAAGHPQAATEAPVHMLAAAVIHMRVSGQLLAVGVPQHPAIRAFINVALCQARQPSLIPASFADLEQRLEETTAVSLDYLVVGLARVAVNVGPQAGSVQFSIGDPADAAGDSVTDVLTWVQQQVPADGLTDPDASPGFWQPVFDTVVAAARRDDRSQHALRSLQDDLRGTGWAALASALGQLAADPTAFAMPDDLESAERVIVQHAIDTLRAAS